MKPKNLFIQTSDIHIGHCRTLSNYIERHLNVITQITQVAEKSGLPLVIAGDIFHSKTTKHEERLLFYYWLSQLEKKKIPTIIITGNHDHLYGELTQLHGLDQIPFTYIRIVSWHPKLIKVNGIAFICIPWRKYTKDELEKTVRQYLPSITDCAYKVVVLHECIAGVKLDTNYIMPVGTSLPNIPEITYWALGDIHNHQRANLGNSWYSGSPSQLQFGDVLPKGVIIPNLDKPTDKPEFIPIKVKPLKIITSVDEITEDAYYKVEGSFEEVIKANENAMVVSSELSNIDIQTIEYDKSDITDGLAAFLYNKGIDETRQKQAIDWVNSLFTASKGA